MVEDSGKFEVLLACTVCGTKRADEFSMPELLNLVDVQSKLMACERCQVSTSWSALEQDRRAGSRRSSWRVPVRMPIHVQTDPDGGGLAETTHTVNVSKGGVRFFSQRNYAKGMELLVRVPYDEEFEQVSVRAKVVWLSPVTQGFHVGIDFLT